MFPNINQKQMEKMMHKMGVKQEEIEAEEVIIKCADKQIRITNPKVIKVNMMGQESLQITGDMEEKELEKFSEEDVKTVMEQANCTEKEAKEALEETGDLAEAILKLKKD